MKFSIIFFVLTILLVAFAVSTTETGVLFTTFNNFLHRVLSKARKVKAEKVLERARRAGAEIVNIFFKDIFLHVLSNFPRFRLDHDYNNGQDWLKWLETMTIDI